MAEGLSVSDDLIRDEVRKFASILGSAESFAVVNEPIWLERFKSKNGLTAARRRVSRAEKEGISPRSNSGSWTSNGVSGSPTGRWDGILRHQARNDFKTKSFENSCYTNLAWSQSQAHSQSSALLSSNFWDKAIASSCTGDFRSSLSVYISPMSSCGPSHAIPA